METDKRGITINVYRLPTIRLDGHRLNRHPAVTVVLVNEGLRLKDRSAEKLRLGKNP